MFTAMVFKVDGTTGAILSSLHSTNGAVRFISEAVVFDRYLYILTLSSVVT
jgi:hypothetical protein